ncbi:MFS transporter [Planctomycetota bacterium]|nr:MFS transporter [Planctomycetota bacterium]
MGLMAFLPELTFYVGQRFKITDPDELTFWGGMIYGAAPFSAALAGPIWGALGDRRGRRPMAIRANLAIAAITLLMPFAASPGWLLFLRALMGVLAGYVAPAIAMVSSHAAPERHGRTIAWLQVAMAMGSFAGPLLGWLVALGVTNALPADFAPWWGRASCFWITTVLSLIGAFLLWRYATEERRPPRAQQVPFVRELLLGIRQLLGNRVFAWLLVLVLMLRLGQNMLEPFVALFVRELGPIEALNWLIKGDEQILSLTASLAFSVLAVAQWVCTPLWGRLSDRFGPLRCLAFVGLLLGLLQIGTASVQGIYSFMSLRILAACVMAGSMTLSYAAASKRVDEGRRTLAFAMVQSCMQLGFGCGGMLGSAISRIGATALHPNLRLPFVVAGLLCITAGMSMFALRRRSLSTARAAPLPETIDLS